MKEFRTTLVPRYPKSLMLVRFQQLLLIIFYLFIYLIPLKKNADILYWLRVAL